VRACVRARYMYLRIYTRGYLSRLFKNCSNTWSLRCL